MFFITMGGGFAVFGGYQVVTTWQFMQEAQPLQATVAVNPASCDDDGSCTWWPKFWLRDPAGDIRWTKTRFGASNYGYSEDSEVTVLYNPSSPYVRMPGADNLYLLGGSFFAIGMLPVVIAIWLLFRVTFYREGVDDADTLPDRPER